MHTLQTLTYDLRRQNLPLIHTLFSLRFTFYILVLAQNENFDFIHAILKKTQPSLVMDSKAPLHGSKKGTHAMRLTQDCLGLVFHVHESI